MVVTKLLNNFAELTPDSFLSTTHFTLNQQDQNDMK